MGGTPAGRIWATLWFCICVRRRLCGGRAVCLPLPGRRETYAVCGLAGPTPGRRARRGVLVQYTVVRAKLVGRDVWALAVSCEVQETNTICYSCPPVVVRYPSLDNSSRLNLFRNQVRNNRLPFSGLLSCLFPCFSPVLCALEVWTFVAVSSLNSTWTRYHMVQVQHWTQFQHFLLS